MPSTLLVTNDYPPTLGGIQSYLRDFVNTLDQDKIMVFASTQDEEAARHHDAQAAHRVIRWPRTVMLPTPTTAEVVGQIVEEYGIRTVWFGASAPLGLLAPAARAAGAERIIATTHGHEVGWSMLPGARQALRRIGTHADVITYISEYTMGRIRPAFGEHPDYVHLPSAVNTELFKPATPQKRAQTRRRFGFGEEPLIVCISRLVPRKGQDQLIRVLPRLVEAHQGTRLLLVGEGGYENSLRKLAESQGLGPEALTFTGALAAEDMRAVLAAADVFAMPARTRGGGLDVEGLGIVYLEAQASGIPVVAGDSGGAPETVTPETGIVVDGRSTAQLHDALDRLLSSPILRQTMGRAGRDYVEKQWTWDVMGARLRGLLSEVS